MSDKVYIAIDLKSFYASVECIERNLDPLATNLVVADQSRTEKTICLAVSPSLKSYGIPGRARLFEVVQRVKQVNIERRHNAPNHKLVSSSSNDLIVKAQPEVALDYIVAPPRMAHYMEYSTKIYEIYLKYVAPEDIHVYSIDEVFIDATNYLQAYQLKPREFAMRMILDVLHTTGITATAGIGTNLYLCKVAMDIGAKHTAPDKNGVRIAELDEMGYRQKLWSHRPLTDFWRVGKGLSRKLEAHGLYTMGDIARCSVGKETNYLNEELLYKLFGVNAELLIDHAWGWEPTTIADIKAYKPSTNSVGSGQVLQCAYTFQKARIIIREMADLLSLDLLEKGLISDQIVMTVGYDIECLTDPKLRNQYHGEITKNHYGRAVPKAAHGTENLGQKTSSTNLIVAAALRLYDRIVDPQLLVRRVYITATHVISEAEAAQEEKPFEQMDLFTDYVAVDQRRGEEKSALEKERKIQTAILDIKKKFGKNSILKGVNFQEGATTIERNNQIGGHKA